MSFVTRTTKSSARFVAIGLLLSLVSTIVLASNWGSVTAFAGFGAGAQSESASVKKDSALVKEFLEKDTKFVIGTCESLPGGVIEVEGTGGTGTQPTGYATLGAAFAAINTGVHTGAIVIDVCGDTTEGTATAILNASGTGSALYTGITISPAGGAGRTISGATTAGSPTIDFVGADNVTVNGLNSGGNTLTISNTTVSATSGTATIRFIGGATTNTITNSNIQGSGTMAVGTNGGNIYFATDAVTANGNDNNTVSNDNIGPAGANLPTKGIYGNGSTTTTAIGNSGNTISGNNIFDYFGAAVTSAGMYVSSGNTDWTIQNNKFYQTATRTQTTGGQHSAIWIANASGNNFLISGNTIGFSAANGTGTYNFGFVSSSSLFIPIFLNVGTTTSTSIQGNTIAGLSMTGAGAGTSSTAAFRGIYVSAGLTNIGDVTGNTIGSQSAAGSITYTSSSTSASDVIGIFNFGSSNWTVNNNTVGGITAANSSTGASNIYGLRVNTGNAVTLSFQNNTVGGTVANSLQSTSTATGTVVQGILNSNPIGIITGNTIRNLTSAGGTGTSTTASVVGIVSTSTANQTISQNTIFNLSNTNTTAATTVTGIQFTGSTANVVARNLIYGLTSTTTGTAAEINGIRVAGGTTIYRNNMIAIGTGTANAIGAAPGNSGTSGINGINEFLGTDSFFHNSIYIGGSPTAGLGASYAFNGTQTTNARSFRDNIFFNARSNSGATGKNYAVKINGTTANPTGLTINNNLYFANGTGGVFGFFNSLDVANLGAWKTAVGQDASSFESNPQYIDPTNAAPNLHLSAVSPTAAEGNGADVGVTDDFDGQTRSGLTPVDIGADAGNFTSSGDLGPPAITYTILGNTTSTANRPLTISVTDIGSGVPMSGVGLPVLYFRKGTTGAYSSTQCTFGSGSAYNCTFDYSLVGGVVGGDTIQYYVAAQDAAGTPNISVNPAAGASGLTANPPAAATPPTPPNSYLISISYTGSYNAGTGENYTSLTNPGGIFEALNAGVLTGNVTINITTDLTGETGTVALNQQAEEGAGAGTYTVTIKPSGAARSITGTGTNAVVININGADRVTIDGSLSGGMDRSLTISNTNPATGTAALRVGSLGAGAGATNDTIKNCIIQAGTVGSTSVTTFGIYLSATRPARRTARITII